MCYRYNTLILIIYFVVLLILKEAFRKSMRGFGLEIGVGAEDAEDDEEFYLGTLLLCCLLLLCTVYFLTKV